MNGGNKIIFENFMGNWWWLNFYLEVSLPR
jgi:hypothetical protein